jgi:ABC-2 type transport system ATP-binding protein
MLLLSGLSKRYGAHEALVGLDLSVAHGEIYCLLGANGAGKTTTINIVLGFLTPDSGSARVDGLDPAAEPEAVRRRIAYIPEQVALYPQLTGLENLRYFTSLGGPRPHETELASTLARAGLGPDAAHRPLGGYSKGMRQKVGIAIALARRARLLLLDEPMSGLDPKAANDFIELVRALAADGAAVLMATHDLFRAKQLATRIGILRAGRKVDELDPTSIDAAGLEAVYLRHMST